MKRDENLQPLSRQHHDELLSCLLIRKGVEKKANVTDLKGFTNLFWKDDLVHNIEKEENILLPFLVKHQFEESYINLLRNDHEIMKSLLERINTFDERHRIFSIFADIVEQHIRFEERFLFGKMQELISAEELEKLGLQLEDTNYRKCVDYPVKFWQ